MKRTHTYKQTTANAFSVARVLTCVYSMHIWSTMKCTSLNYMRPNALHMVTYELNTHVHPSLSILRATIG
jgi:hypothetical protein